MKPVTKSFSAVFLTLIIVLATAGIAFANSITGPSSSQSPYIVQSQPGVVTKAILTVGDSVNLKPDGVTPYRMVGISDGLGAFDNGDGTFTLLMNHEIPSGLGMTRAHGAPGAFISKWIIRTEDLTVLHGEDLIQNVMAWNTTTYQYRPATVAQKTFMRFCSADLPAPSAFYDSASGLGYNGRIYMNGEEVSEGVPLLICSTAPATNCLGWVNWPGKIPSPTQPQAYPLWWQEWMMAQVGRCISMWVQKQILLIL